MVRKVVKVSNLDIVPFLYPDYRLKREITFSDTGQKIIYAGPYIRKIKDLLDSYTNDWICLAGAPDLDLSANSSLLRWYCETFKHRVSEKVINQVDQMDDDQFMFMFKIFTVTGRWRSEEEHDLTTFDLFKATSGGLRDYIKVAQDLMEIYPFHVVEASYLTFLQRVKNIDDQSVSPHYLRVLKSANQKIGSKINRAVMQYASRDNLREELRFLSLQLGLR